MNYYIYSPLPTHSPPSGGPLLDGARPVAPGEGADRQPERVQPGAAPEAGLLPQQHGGLPAAETPRGAPLPPQLDQRHPAGRAALRHPSEPGGCAG